MLILQNVVAGTEAGYTVKKKRALLGRNIRSLKLIIFRTYLPMFHFIKTGLVALLTCVVFFFFFAYFVTQKTSQKCPSIWLLAITKLIIENL